MLQALYSRDPKSVLRHLEKLKKEGSGKVMGLFMWGIATDQLVNVDILRSALKTFQCL